MNEKLREQILATIGRAIVQGFEREQEIFESTYELIHNQDVDEAWFRQQLSEAYREQLAQERHWPPVNHFDQLALVFDRLGKDGIIALHNAGATRQDGIDDAYDLWEDAQAAGFHPVGYCYYHAQDINHAIENNHLWIGFGDFTEDLPLTKAVGRTVAGRLRDGGFRVEWPDDPEQRIRLTGIVWQKRHDDRDFSYSRAIAQLT